MAAIITTDVVNGQATDAGVVNANFTAIKTVVNGSLDNANLAARRRDRALEDRPLGHGGRRHDLRSAGSRSGGPKRSGAGAGAGSRSGRGMDYWGATASLGLAVCRRQRRLAHDLRGALCRDRDGLGAGDGSASFNLPDKRGRASMRRALTPTWTPSAIGRRARRGPPPQAQAHRQRPRAPLSLRGESGLRGAWREHGGREPRRSGNVQALDLHRPRDTRASRSARRPTRLSTGPAYLVCNYLIYTGV